MRTHNYLVNACLLSCLYAATAAADTRVDAETPVSEQGGGITLNGATTLDGLEALLAAKAQASAAQHFSSAPAQPDIYLDDAARTYN